MNTKHIGGIPVVSLGAGERLGNVSDIVLAADGTAVVALAVRSAGGLLAAESATTRWLAAEDVHVVGPDALTVESAAALREGAPVDGSLSVADLAKRKVVTEGGTYVGQIASVEVDEHGLAVTHLEVSPGFFKANRMVPTEQVVTVGAELVIVADAVCADASEPDGGGADAADAEHLRIVGDVEPRATP